MVLDRLRLIFNHWPALVGFWAGFGMQFAVLNMFKEDQGDLETVAAGFYQRLTDLTSVLPLVVSGSSFAARYTGVELTGWAAMVVTGLVALFAGVGVLAMLIVAGKKRSVKFLASLLWLAGLIIGIVVLMYMVDRYSLRYFVMFVLGLWALAGVGAGVALAGVFSKNKNRVYDVAVLISLGLVVAVVLNVWMPFLSTGGSMEVFSLGNRTDSAAAFVNERPLLNCLRGAGSVYSENVHIWNRLWYLSHNYEDLVVIDEGDGGRQAWTVNYRLSEDEVGDICPELKHFVVIRND